MNRVLRGKVNTSPVPLFENNNCFSRGFLHLHITASLILGFQILKMLKENYVFFFFPPPFRRRGTMKKGLARCQSEHLCAPVLRVSSQGRKKKKIEILRGGRQRRSLLPSAAAPPSYAAGERLVSAEWRGWSGEAALLQTAVSLTDNEWPGSIWKQQPWTNMMYTSSLANGRHQFCLHHGDRRRRRRRLRQEAPGNVTNSS